MTTSLSTTAVGSVRDQLTGPLLLPGAAGYDDARSVWNAIVDRQPQMIIRCMNAGDVAIAVRTARELDLEIGVRCGGHNMLGLAVPDGGLMIDLSLMGAVRIDPARRRAWVQGGALLGALDAASQRYGLATTAGNVSHTGVGGLTLGGGMGWLARQYGLACDNVESFEMVTADGKVVRASQHENPELFWGLRGGGGNFGVVTEFEFRLHPVGTQALVAEFSFPARRALSALRGWRDLLEGAPRQATLTASVGQDEMATVGFVWVGEPHHAQPLLSAMRALGRPSMERVFELPYLELQRMDDTVQGHALRRYATGHYLQQLPDVAIEAFLLRGTPSGCGDNLPNVGLQAYGGAIAEVPDDDSAFSHRGTLVEYGAAARWSDPSQDQARIGTARSCAAALDTYASGAYVNFLSDKGAESVRRAYSAEKLTRLTGLKDAYDPDNIFHLNHNIQPTDTRGDHDGKTGSH
jgi:FAD binding domain/Berberine and berberine like